MGQSMFRPESMGVPSITKKQILFIFIKNNLFKKGKRKPQLGFWIWIEGIGFSLAIMIMIIFFGGFFIFLGWGALGRCLT